LILEPAAWFDVTHLNSNYTVFQKKTCDHIFDDKLNYNCPFTKIFGTHINKSIGDRQIFRFPPHLLLFSAATWTWESVEI